LADPTRGKGNSNAGSGVVCAFEGGGLDNVDLDAFMQILRQNYSEAE